MFSVAKYCYEVNKDDGLDPEKMKGVLLADVVLAFALGVIGYLAYAGILPNLSKPLSMALMAAGVFELLVTIIVNCQAHYVDDEASLQPVGQLGQGGYRASRVANAW